MLHSPSAFSVAKSRSASSFWRTVNAELQAIQTRLETLESERKVQEEANWAGLVKLYEGMRPRDAAVIFNALDKHVLLEILDRMKPAKAASVLALMDPEGARQITTDLAEKRTRSTTIAN
jgi:flagellar motility protein MotE (MotC chaperone)